MEVLCRAQPTQSSGHQLYRSAGRHYLQFGVGQVVPETRAASPWGSTWPQTALDLGVDPGLILKALGGNHFSLILGDIAPSLAHAALEAGIGTVRLDRAEALHNWLERVRLG